MLGRYAKMKRKNKIQKKKNKPILTLTFFLALSLFCQFLFISKYTQYLYAILVPSHSNHFNTHQKQKCCKTPKHTKQKIIFCDFFPLHNKNSRKCNLFWFKFLFCFEFFCFCYLAALSRRMCFVSLFFFSFSVLTVVSHVICSTSVRCVFVCVLEQYSGRK